MLALIKKYWKKIKEARLYQDNILIYLNVYLPIICQAAFLIVLKTSFSLILIILRLYICYSMSC